MVTMRTAIRYKQHVQIYILDEYTTCDPERKILYGNYLRHQDDDDEMVEAMETAEFFNDDDGDDQGPHVKFSESMGSIYPMTPIKP